MEVRENDAQECRAAGMEPWIALDHCVRMSTAAFQHRHDGKVIATWGYRERGFLTQTIDAWMLTAPEVEDHKVLLARQSKRWVDDMLTKYAAIYVEVHARYDAAHKWLLWLGFVYVETRTTRGGESFLIMRKDRG